MCYERLGSNQGIDTMPSTEIMPSDQANKWGSSMFPSYSQDSQAYSPIKIHMLLVNHGKPLLNLKPHGPLVIQKRRTRWKSFVDGYPLNSVDHGSDKPYILYYSQSHCPLPVISQFYCNPIYGMATPFTIYIHIDNQ